MIDYFHTHLGPKLLLSYLAILLLAVLVLVSATQFTLPTAFNRHLAGMEPQMMAQRGDIVGNNFGGIPPGTRRGPFLQAGGMMQELYDNFRASFNEALGYSILTAIVAAVLVSVFFTRRIVAPLRAMMGASQRIADGHYDERVKVSGSDELADLAERFNGMAERLEHTESMRRQLIGDVSHELRTPLTAIKGYMEGLMDGVLPATPETYAEIHREADRLSRLVEDLQELSRVEAGSYSLELRDVALAGLVATAIKRLSYQFEAKNVEMKLALPDGLPLVQVDEDRVIQVLTNLLGNALMYTPAGGIVTISAARREDGLQVAVNDTGVGISPEHLPHIFDRFYRADRSRSRQGGGGSGIGLTIARYLVEAHGGHIWAESAGVGQGSTFFFTLPLAR